MSKIYCQTPLWEINIFKLVLLICITIILFNSNTYSQQGLKAEYYDGTDFNRLETVKYVPNIDLSWHSNPPVSGIDPFECSIRWTGKLKPAKSGTYTFSAQVDDGIRVWIDDQLIIDQWDLNDLGVFTGTIDLEARQEYKLKVDYFNGMLEGEVRLLWAKHKEALGWYERMFGEDFKFIVIAPAYFSPPVEPIKIKKDVEVKTKKKVRETTTKKKIIAKKTEQKAALPQPKEIEKPEPPKPVVDAKEVEKYIPKDVQFAKGKTIILEPSYKELNTFIQFMLKYPHLKVKVEGHTDVVGDPELNLQLSKDRATTITNYLIEKGIDRLRIKSNGFGSSRPLFVPENGKSHPANRRVMFIVD